MEPTKQPITRLDYCQYLLSSQINYTLTNFADHTTAFSHDKLNRYLGGDKITPHLVWENVKEQVVQCVNGYIVFDDTDYVITNDLTQNDIQAVQDVCGLRWKIEQFHRETKQVAGLEACQCRKARIVRNHIGCAILVWVRLKQVAQETQRTTYRVKHDLLSDYLRQQLKLPTVKMALA